MKPIPERHQRVYEVAGELLRKKRLAANLTAEYVAGRLGRKVSYLEGIEQGLRKFNIVELMDMCACIGCDICDFVREYQEASNSVGII